MSSLKSVSSDVSKSVGVPTISSSTVTQETSAPSDNRSRKRSQSQAERDEMTARGFNLDAGYLVSTDQLAKWKLRDLEKRRAREAKAKEDRDASDKAKEALRLDHIAILTMDYGTCTAPIGSDRFEQALK